ncbi:MAG: D-2-hydroxyacid dehydrogenase [Sporolactobacillus sp.]
MKFMMYTVRDDELPAIQEWAEQHRIEVTTVREDLDGETVRKSAGYDGICIQQRGRISDEGIYRSLHEFGMRQLATRTAGYDMIDLQLASAYGLAVTNVPAYSPRSVAELVLIQMMRLLRNLPLFEARMQVQDFRWSGLMAREVRTQTVGIIGAGRIGGTLARMLHALGATVVANDIVRRPELETVLSYVSKEELLRRADIVTLHVPLLELTRHLIDDYALSLMKSDACLINASRGPVVDTDALIRALKQRRIAGAALDTIDGEEHFFNTDLRTQQLPSDQLIELRKLPNVLITPHIGFYTNMAVKNMVEISLNDVLEVLTTARSEHQVNQPLVRR